MSGEHTDYDDHTVVGCPLCGATHTKGFMLCGTLFEPPELDFRAGSLVRFLLEQAIAECPACHFCFDNWLPAEYTLRVDSPLLTLFVASPEYQRPLARVDRAPLGRRFEARGSIAADGGDHLARALYYVVAAWAYDDAHQAEAALRARRAALDALATDFRGTSRHFEEYALEDFRVLRFEGAADLLRADLLRRAGDFSSAQAVVERATRNSAMTQWLHLRFDALLAAIEQRDGGARQAPLESWWDSPWRQR